MLKPIRIALLAGAFLLSGMANAFQFLKSTEPVNAAARYYAGLDAPSQELFRKQADRIWKSYEKQIGQPLRNWAEQEVHESNSKTVFYPFSGPDFLTVERIYPEASRYVLVAIQSAQRPTLPSEMNSEQRNNFEKKLAAAWEKFGILGYFRTDDLNEDQREKSARLGVTAILMAFSARLGYEVESVSPLEFNAENGEWGVANAKEVSWKSVRLQLKKGSRKIKLDYLSMDLSDGGLRRDKEKTDWLRRMSKNPILLKAASHLLQDPYFKIMRTLVVEETPLLVQDETGLTYTDLTRVGDVILYGNFIKPHGLFKTTRQHDLATAYRVSKTRRDLPFAFSYLKKSEMRSVQIARRAGAVDTSDRKSEADKR